jgi:hypothetical protein
MERKNHKYLFINLFTILIAFLGILLFWRAGSALGNNSGSINSTSNPPPSSFQKLMQPPTQIPEGKNQDVIVIEKQEPRKIDEHLDLATGLADKDKFVYIVQRADGTFSEIIVPGTLENDVKSFMELGPRDKIITGYPLYPRNSFPSLEKPAVQVTLNGQTILSSPYPQPTNPYP